MRRMQITTVLAAVLLAGCAAVTVSDDEMARMGDQTYAQMKAQLPRSWDAGQIREVNCVANALVTEIHADNAPQTWEVTVFKQDEVNAFALPGGNIGVYTGLLDVTKSPDQLAAVMGHEIAHVIARHAAHRVERQRVTNFGVNVLGAASGNQGIASALGLGAQLGLTLPFNRGQEQQADLMGLEYMSRAGFDPEAAVELWKAMEKKNSSGPPELLSTHPSGATRIQEIEAHLPKMEELYKQAKAAGKNPQC